MVEDDPYADYDDEGERLPASRASEVSLTLYLFLCRPRGVLRRPGFDFARPAQHSRRPLALTFSLPRRLALSRCTLILCHQALVPIPGCRWSKAQSRHGQDALDPQAARERLERRRQGRARCHLRTYHRCSERALQGCQGGGQEGHRRPDARGRPRPPQLGHLSARLRFSGCVHLPSASTRRSVRLIVLLSSFTRQRVLLLHAPLELLPSQSNQGDQLAHHPPLHPLFLQSPV